ncbi:MAG: hypothetical protein KAV00_09170 [Phycisphaerae bacterium]|nr:hypothetical protein [Phycisphaerae bacterium]
MTDIEAFENSCLKNWEVLIRSRKMLLNSDVPRIQDFCRFDKSKWSLKTHIAEKIIRESKSSASLVDSGDVAWFLDNFALEIHNQGAFDNRRTQAIRSSVLLLTRRMWFSINLERSDILGLILQGGQAPATNYLLSQLEYLFRIKSRYLNANGTINRHLPTQLLRMFSRKYKVGHRVNRITDAFKLYLYRNGTCLGRRLNRLEKGLSMSNRLAIRHPALHGFHADISVEGYLYALIIAMFYYSEGKE